MEKNNISFKLVILLTFLIFIIVLLLLNKSIVFNEDGIAKKYIENLSNQEIVNIDKKLQKLYVYKINDVNEIGLDNIFNLYVYKEDIKNKILLGQDVEIPANDFREYIENTFCGYVLKQEQLENEFGASNYMYDKTADTIKLLVNENTKEYFNEDQAESIVVKRIEYINDIAKITYKYENTESKITRNDVITVKVNENGYQYVAYDFSYNTNDAIKQPFVDLISSYLDENKIDSERILEFKINNIDVYSNNYRVYGTIDYTVKPYAFSNNESISLEAIENNEWVKVGTRNGEYVDLLQYFKLLLNEDNVFELEDLSMTPYDEMKNINKNANEQILYDGYFMESKVGLQFIGPMLKPICSSFDIKYKVNDFKRPYYNYKNSMYQGIIIGDIGNYEEDGFLVNNVHIGIPYEYNAIPREVTITKELPQIISKANNKIPKYSELDVLTADLDGDNTNEYIVVYVDKKKVDSQIVLYDNLGNYVADLVVLKDGYWFKHRHIDNAVYMSNEYIDVIDIDNDNIMEILIEIPGALLQLSILKYKNGILEGETSVVPYLAY